MHINHARKFKAKIINKKKNKKNQVVKDEVKAILLLLLSFKLIYTKIQQLKNVKLYNTEQLLTFF